MLIQDSNRSVIRDSFSNDNRNARSVINEHHNTNNESFATLETSENGGATKVRDRNFLRSFSIPSITTTATNNTTSSNYGYRPYLGRYHRSMSMNDIDLVEVLYCLYDDAARDSAHVPFKSVYPARCLQRYGTYPNTHDIAQKVIPRLVLSFYVSHVIKCLSKSVKIQCLIHPVFPSSLLVQDESCKLL